MKDREKKKKKSMLSTLPYVIISVKFNGEVNFLKKKICIYIFFFEFLVILMES